MSTRLHSNVNNLCIYTLVAWIRFKKTIWNCVSSSLSLKHAEITDEPLPKSGTRRNRSGLCAFVMLRIFAPITMRTQIFESCQRHQAIENLVLRRTYPSIISVQKYYSSEYTPKRGIHTQNNIHCYDCFYCSVTHVPFRWIFSLAPLFWPVKSDEKKQNSSVWNRTKRKAKGLLKPFHSLALQGPIKPM